MNQNWGKLFCRPRRSSPPSTEAFAVFVRRSDWAAPNAVKIIESLLFFDLESAREFQSCLLNSFGKTEIRKIWVAVGDTIE